MRETEKEFSTRLCLLRRCGGHTTAGELAWLEEEKEAWVL